MFSVTSALLLDDQGWLGRMIPAKEINVYKCLFMIFILVPLSATAEYRKLNAKKIQVVLAGKELVYEDGKQQFGLSGETRSIYYDGTYRGSWGLSGDQYCQKFKEPEGW